MHGVIASRKKLPKKVAEIKARGRGRRDDQLRSDELGGRSVIRQPNSERSSFQHLTPSLKEDNDGRTTSRPDYEHQSSGNYAMTGK
ncbi:hypothetical protein EYF80_003292 [Liparis tanakae]|uniref:Uncharacterized protein n=1 Tax=Liparis tanakae TaxID=230148 RepID=A0A4Z2JAX3_9TELE|nr:hypothetical protein EYF80_003292 [Liparis tanakae]